MMRWLDSPIESIVVFLENSALLNDLSGREPSPRNTTALLAGGVFTDREAEDHRMR